MDQQTSDQFKEIEQFYSLSSFRNREFASGKGTTFVTRIDVPNRSKRHDYSSIPIHQNSRKNLCFEWQVSSISSFASALGYTKPH